uniref:Uncharacterized protein n=1 Tax=Arundo donax TaxID=35708 RepID=A0A0A9EKM7_ARUDO
MSILCMTVCMYHSNQITYFFWTHEEQSTPDPCCTWTQRTGELMSRSSKRMRDRLFLLDS